MVNVPEISTSSLPPLARVPNISEDSLQIKITHTGVTLLREGSYKKRFTGGESVVDINGTLHLSRKDYKNALKKEAEERERHLISLSHTPKKATGKKKARHNLHEVPGETMLNGLQDTPIPKQPKKIIHKVNKKEVTNRLQSMASAVFSAKKQNDFIGMLTVSFPPCVTQALAMQALNTWFTAIRQKGKRYLRNYIWVAEFQDGKRLADPSKATGTIHYHILILNRMNIQKVNRAMMVVLCNMVRDGLIDYPLAAMKRYNGVDLCKDRKTKQVTNFCDHKSRKALGYYITKYVTKNNAEFEHAAWGNSRAFSAIFTGITCTMRELLRMGWNDEVWQNPAIITQWFDFYPWLKETGPPVAFSDYLSKVNMYILDKRGLLN